MIYSIFLILEGGGNCVIVMEIFLWKPWSLLHIQVDFLLSVNFTIIIMCSLEAHELNLEKASHLWREFKSIPGAKFAKNKGFLKTS